VAALTERRPVMDEHMTVIETSAILKLLDAQLKTHEVLYDLVMIMRENEKRKNDSNQLPKAEMKINR
jgi:hypothetical protein